VRTLKTSEAAALLSVSPNTLRAWERRFGYPKPLRSPGRHRLYTHGEVAALRDALQEGLSISSAVSRAREALTGDTHILVGALTAFELDRADAALESALALRSVERVVEDVLLPSLWELGDRHGYDSAPWAFAARWAGDWLHRAHRLSPAPVRPFAILIGDATRDDVDPDALALRAFSLFCVRAGARVLILPVGSVSGLAEVLAAFRPQGVVVAGRNAPDDIVSRWAYRVRSNAGVLPTAVYRRGEAGRRTTGTGPRSLGDTPGEAHRTMLAMIESSPRPDAAVLPAGDEAEPPARYRWSG
jgi:MerR family transcriptional regulator, light-induced transcriptional regulator